MQLARAQRPEALPPPAETERARLCSRAWLDPLVLQQQEGKGSCEGVRGSARWSGVHAIAAFGLLRRHTIALWRVAA